MDNQMQKNQMLKRTFIIGDEWLYMKFYTGPKSADLILTEMVKPVSEQLLEEGAIDHWFFIRYSDPKSHTRVRFHVPNPENLNKVILSIREHAAEYIAQSLVWKVQADTYEREVERYGINSMELSEKIFFLDSRMIVGMLAMIEGDEGERIRWLFALRTMDTLLDDFRLDIEQKYNLITILRENFGREHGMNRSLKDQLENKFRKERSQINEILDRANDEVSEMLPLFQLITEKSEGMKPLVDEIKNLEQAGRLHTKIEDLIPSYSHMMINRLFKSKQRLHELVIYDFLHRYYKSEIARRKYSKINEEKKKKKEAEKAK